MAHDQTHQTQLFEIPAEMRAFAERSVEQARKAFDGFMTAAQQAADKAEGQAATVRAGAKDVHALTIRFAEQNMAASFDFAQKLVRAQNAEELMRLQADYVKSQMQALAEQAKELSAKAGKIPGKSAA